MSSSADYLQFVLEQLAGLGDDVTYRKMMGEYIIYYKEKVVGGIYDNRFLLKDVPAARSLTPFIKLELPYPSAKPMILVDNVDDADYACNIVKVVAENLK